MSFPNRLARTGEELVCYRFPSGSLGLASQADVDNRTSKQGPFRSVWSYWFGSKTLGAVPAVCIPPGSRLLVRDISEQLQREMNVRKLEEVTFTQITANSSRFRDAIRFRSGQEVLLQKLMEGQRVRVLDTSLTEVTDPDREHLNRLEYQMPIPAFYHLQLIV
jgi:hypothetical protein